MSRQAAKPLSGWHSEDVKAAVRKRGETLVSLARRNHFSESYLRSVLIRPLYQGEQIIAKFIGVKPQVIWPDRYNADGSPKNRKATKAPTTLRRRA